MMFCRKALAVAASLLASTTVSAQLPILSYDPGSSDPATGTYVFASQNFTSAGAATLTLSGWDGLTPPNTTTLSGSAVGGNWTFWYSTASLIAFQTTLEGDATFTVHADPNLLGDLTWSRSAGGSGTVTITAPVPEPHGFAWLGALGLAGFALWRRRAPRDHACRTAQR